ncbi:AraC-type DNA-binding protein [Halanaerobium salsuginis]|uniref:AraC-type DNA-binding protein n=2 Tax=Halanaerobium salsuginis TaxID=29563 RepID=A0A1I4N5M5_9FIRM|nr:AraC-type DNA-binding protein [Halanaerobium salsuginis]
MIFIKELYEPMKDRSFWILKQKFNQSYEMESRHYHNHYELYYLLSGERNYFVKDRSYHIRSGDLILINKNDLHHTSNANDYHHEKIMIYFKEEYIKNLFNWEMMIDLFSVFNHKSNMIRLNIANQEIVEELLLKLLAEYSDYQKVLKDHQNNIVENELLKEASQRKLFHLKIMLTELLYKLKEIIKDESADFMHSNPLHKTISDIAGYINKNYQHEIRLNDLADEFSLNSCYLSSKFKEITGFSLIEYLNLIRLKKAKELLINSKLSITKISEKVGFNTLSHFGRIFKQYNNLSASNYRKLNSKM